VALGLRMEVAKRLLLILPILGSDLRSAIGPPAVRSSADDKLILRCLANLGRSSATAQPDLIFSLDLFVEGFT
jgi:hypothetical protein